MNQLLSELEERFLSLDPFGTPQDAAEPLKLARFRFLTELHRQNNDYYKRIFDAWDIKLEDTSTVSSIPFLPVRLFKLFELHSVAKNQIIKTMTSSGTSGQAVSQIFLDARTAYFQSKVLSRIVQQVIGPKRLPMLIFDAPSTIRDRSHFSARGAAILGFSMFGRDVCFALNDQLSPNVDAIRAFLARYGATPFLVFGFTSIVWESFHKHMLGFEGQLSFDNGILLHGGGWKRLTTQSVDNQFFKQTLMTSWGFQRVVNYYGMVEQTGSIFIECGDGNLHSSVFSDIFFRRMSDFEVSPIGELGVVEVMSVIPTSYPGHALLTEDLGVLLGEDNCTCGWKGKYFHIHGRLAEAEIRGCSDVRAVSH